MVKFGGPGLNGKPCSRKRCLFSLLLQDLYPPRFCAKDCGVCPSCLTKPQFGGQEPGAVCPYRGAKWRLPGKAPKKAKLMACGVKGYVKKVRLFSILPRTSSASRSC